MLLPDEIVDWLHELLGDNAAYQFEVCDRTVSILQSLMSYNRQQDKEASIRIKDQRQKAKEYRMESRAMKLTLNFIGLTFDHLSESCWKYLSSLSKTAELLQLSQLSDTNYIIGLIDLRHRIEEVERQNYIQKREFVHLKCDSQTLETLEEQFQNLRLDPLFARINRGRELKFRSYEQKFYNGQSAKKTKQLIAVGANSLVSHKKIVASKKELDSLQKKCMAVHSELKMFHNLPPSLSKIQVAVQQMDDERKKLESRLSDCIDSSVL